FHRRSHNISSRAGESPPGISSYKVGISGESVDQCIGRVEIQVVHVILVVFMACHTVDGVFSDLLVIGEQLLGVDNCYVLVSLSKSPNTLVRAGFTVAVPGSYLREPIIGHIGGQFKVFQKAESSITL